MEQGVTITLTPSPAPNAYSATTYTTSASITDYFGNTSTIVTLSATTTPQTITTFSWGTTVSLPILGSSVALPSDLITSTNSGYDYSIFIIGGWKNQDTSDPSLAELDPNSYHRGGGFIDYSENLNAIVYLHMDIKHQNTMKLINLMAVVQYMDIHMLNLECLILVED